VMLFVSCLIISRQYWSDDMHPHLLLVSLSEFEVFLISNRLLIFLFSPARNLDRKTTKYHCGTDNAVEGDKRWRKLLLTLE